MNYFHHFYPSLLRLPGFLVEFITPIIKVPVGCGEGELGRFASIIYPSSHSPASHPPPPQVTKGKESISFYTMPEYEEWREAHPARGWSVKYYKVRSAGRGSGLCRTMWYLAGLLACWPLRPPSRLPRTTLAPHPQGLGTSTAAEAKQYFSNILSHRKEFVYEGAYCTALYCCHCCCPLVAAQE